MPTMQTSSHSHRTLIIALSITLIFLLLTIYRARTSSFQIPSLPTQAPPTTPKTYPDIDDTISFYDITQVSLSSQQTINTRGYVSKVTECNCPPNAQCKCVPRQIVISETNRTIENTNDMTAQEMLIYADQPTQFQIGRQYQFTVILDLNRNETLPYSIAKLVGYRPIDVTISADDQDIINQISRISSQNLSCNPQAVQDLIAQHSTRIKFCQTDNDCVLSKLSCSGQEAININWKTTYDYLQDQAHACKDCAAAQIEYTNIRCLNHQCTAAEHSQ